MSAWILLTACGNEASIRPGFTTAELPQPLSLMESSGPQIAQTCATGGVRIVHGVDHNQDGRLGVYERLNVEYFCNPTIAGSGSDVVVTQADKKPAPETPNGT